MPSDRAALFGLRYDMGMGDGKKDSSIRHYSMVCPVIKENRCFYKAPRGADKIAIDIKSPIFYHSASRLLKNTHLLRYAHPSSLPGCAPWPAYRNVRLIPQNFASRASGCF